MLLAVFSLVLTSVLPMMQHSAAAQSDWAPPPTVYLPESGHSLDRLFLDLWRNSGGASTFGYPITPEIEQDNGHIIQYLQYARFEYWPEGDANGNTVLLGKIGEELRPFTVLRSASASTQHAPSAALIESSRQMKAWLPVSEKTIDTTRDDQVYIEETQHTISGGFLTFWYNTGDVAYLGNPLTEEYVIDGTTYQVFERGQLSWSKGGDIQLVPVGKVLAQKYGLDTEPMAQGNIPTYSEDLFIAPEPEPVQVARAGADGEIWVDVNLSTQYMTVYQGSSVLLETYVSTGRAGFDTPPGTFYVNTMLPEQDMEGVLGGEYYNVPAVPDVMYFTNVGHAIHGTYWHNNFGAVMSHGCVNMPMGAADYLYSIAYVGMRVEIHW